MMLTTLINDDSAFSRWWQGGSVEGQSKITGLYGVPFDDDDDVIVSEPYRNLVEQLDAVMYVVEIGKTTRLSYVSPRVAVFGCTPSEWMGNPARHADLIHPDDRAEALDKIRHSRTTGQALCHEYRMLTADGHYAWYRDQLRAVDCGSSASFTMHGMMTDISQDKAKSLLLLQAQQQLRALAKAQAGAVERERHRIAQEIHDELGGSLTAINACISTALGLTSHVGGKAGDLLHDAAALTAGAIRTVREVATDLRPSALDTLGVWAAVEWALEQMEKRTSITCSWRIDAAVQAINLGDERELVVYRIIQEALTNVVRHAQATHVHVSAYSVGAAVYLTVSDNGIGLVSGEQRTDRPSWGVMGMRERAAHFGGSLVLANNPSGGTTLTLTLPLSMEAGHGD